MAIVNIYWQIFGAALKIIKIKPVTLGLLTLSPLSQVLYDPSEFNILYLNFSYDDLQYNRFV